MVQRHYCRFLALIAAAFIFNALPAQAVTLPDPASDETNTANLPASESVVLAGGCFWGMQDVFQHVKGVTQVTAGYAGGDEHTANYRSVSGGDTGHAESVQVTYDPSQVTLGQLLKVYFAVAHDPTELNYQGPDHGTQYRSAVFFATPEQGRLTKAYIAQLQTAQSFNRPIVTEVTPLKGFYPAEDYHQNYAKLHPFNAYIYINDVPKVRDLQRNYPDLYVQG